MSLWCFRKHKTLLIPFFSGFFFSCSFFGLVPFSLHCMQREGAFMSAVIRL